MQVQDGGDRLQILLDADTGHILGATANDMAMKLARQSSGRPKILARYRSYHGASGLAMAATGDPRRWPNDIGTGAIVRVPDAHRYGRRDPEPVERALAICAAEVGPE